MFTIRGVPYNQKVTRSRKKVNQVFNFFFQTRVKNGTRKCVVEVVLSRFTVHHPVVSTYTCGSSRHSQKCVTVTLLKLRTELKNNFSLLGSMFLDFFCEKLLTDIYPKPYELLTLFQSCGLGLSIR